MVIEKVFNHDNEIHVWQLDLKEVDELEESYYEMLSLLSEDEKRRASKYKFDEYRYKWVQCRHLLRTTLSRYVNEDPSELIFAELTFGKPILNSHKHLHFNLSHSINKALLAVTLSGPVGADVEYIKDSGDLLKIATRFFSEEEQGLLSKVDKEDIAESFFTFWTRKEAFIKCLGAGLQIPLDEFTVNLSIEKPAITKIDWDPKSVSEWTLLDIKVGERNKGAIAIKATGVELVIQS